MKTYPAIALIELSGIADGIYTGDAMLKQSPVAMLKAGTISHGKYLVLIGGSVAAVDEAFGQGLAVAQGSTIDSLMLPDIHSDVFAVLLEEKIPVKAEALGILETESVASVIAAADAAIKGADVLVNELRLGDNFGGKGYLLLSGKIEDVEIAMEIVSDVLEVRGKKCCCRTIANLTDGMREHVNGALRFSQSALQILPDGE